MLRQVSLLSIVLFLSYSDGTCQTTYDCIPPGWLPVLASSRSSSFGLDTMVFHSGHASAFIKLPPSEYAGSGALKQCVAADKYVGHTVKLLMFIKIQDVENAYIWYRADGKETALYHTLLQREIENTADWKLYSLILPVPTDAIALEFGVSVTGEGLLWIDDVSLKIDNYAVPSVNRVTEESKNRKQPLKYYIPHRQLQNAGFEE
jgi:hypothetical protein